MREYVIRRLLQSSVILVLLSVAVFLLLRIAPGADPARLRCGLMCSDEHYQQLRQDMGLDHSYVRQYFDWTKSLFNGSLGADWNGKSVMSELQKRMPVTLELMLFTVILTLLIGIPFGIISAIYRNSPLDLSVRFAGILGLAVPNFWLATLVLLIPQALWSYAPPITHTISFVDDPGGNLRQFIPPSIVLAVVSAAGVMRLTRSAMLEVMLQDYIRTARAKGMRERLVVVRHALKNTMIPVVTVVGLQIAAMFGGEVLIENIFNLQGIGNYFLSALLRKDFEVAQTLTLYIGVVVVMLNLGVDLAYAWLDPRIRYT